VGLYFLASANKSHIPNTELDIDLELWHRVINAAIANRILGEVAFDGSPPNDNTNPSTPWVSEFHVDQQEYWE
jgi:hypothetical protein